MKLDKNGLNQLKQEIMLVSEQLNNAKLKKGQTFSDDTNSWHDNAAYDQAKLEVDGLEYQLSSLRRELQEVELVKSHGNTACVDIGDIVELYNKDFDDRFKVLLTANYKVDIGEDDEISEISINSPIGEAIFWKKAGDHTSYKVNNRNFDVEIVSFERAKTKQQNDQRRL